MLSPRVKAINVIAAGSFFVFGAGYQFNWPGAVMAFAGVWLIATVFDV